MNSTPYIFESPDGGKTTTKRKHGLTEKEFVVSGTAIDASSVYTNDMLGSSLIAETLSAAPSYNDITVQVNGKDRSVLELFDIVDTIEKRLAILRPDPELLEKYEMLQSMYDQYKAAEALLCDPTTTGVEEK